MILNKVDLHMYDLRMGLETVSEKFARPFGDVEACRSVSVSFVSTPDACKVSIAFPVLFVNMSTSRAHLAGIVWLDFLHHYAFSLCYVFQRMFKEAVGDTVHLPSTLLAPFILPFLEMSKLLYGNVRVHLLSEFDDLIRYLPQSSLHMVPLFSAEPSEFDSSLASRTGVPILLEFGSTLLEAELSSRHILSIVGLLQNLSLADHGYGYFGAIYVYAHPVRSRIRFRGVFREDDEEPEVPLHYHAGYLPTFLYVLLMPTVCSVLAYWYPYPFMVGSEGDNRFSPLGFSEAEKPTVEANSTPSRLVIHGFPVAPSVTSCLDNKLRRNVILAPELFIGFVVELRACLGSPSQRQQLLNHA